jgi:uncharacterized protein YpuA (DUF1002 family)
MRRVWAGVLALLLLLGFSAPVWAAVRVEVLGRALTRPERLRMLHELGIRPDIPAKIVYVEHYQEEQVVRGIAPPSQIAKHAVAAVYLVPERLGYGIHVFTRNIRFVTGPMYANALTTAGVVDSAIRVYAPYPINGIAAFVDILWGYQAATAANISPYQKRVATRELVLTANLAQRTGRPLAVLETFRLLKEQVAQDHLTGASTIRARLMVDQKHEHLTLNAGDTTAIVHLMESIGRLRLSAAQLHQQVAGLRSEALQAHAWWVAFANLWHWMVRHLFGGRRTAVRRHIDGVRAGSIDSRHRREILVRP